MRQLLRERACRRVETNGNGLLRPQHRRFWRHDSWRIVVVVVVFHSLPLDQTGDERVYLAHGNGRRRQNSFRDEQAGRVPSVPRLPRTCGNLPPPSTTGRIPCFPRERGAGTNACGFLRASMQVQPTDKTIHTAKRSLLACLSIIVSVGRAPRQRGQPGAHDQRAGRRRRPEEPQSDDEGHGDVRL